jgi:SPP1 gp7 family putative phage head morphogenesis protein
MSKTIKQPSYQKSHEKEFERAMQYMVDIISQRFRNQVLKELNKGTIEKFADAQVGNYANIFLGLAKKLKKKLLKQFDDKRLEKIARDVLSKTNKQATEQLYNRVESAIGINSKQLLAQDGMTYITNALILETAQWAKKLRDETLEMYTANTLREMTLGSGLETIMDNFAGMEEKRKNHAKFTARNQIANFNAVSSKIRAQKVGVKKAIWRTAKDERVRTCHADREGKEFDLSEGLYSSCDGKTLLPGTDYQCRCIAEYIIPELEENEE